MIDSDKKIKNPSTGRMIKVDSALTYDHNEPVYKKAKAISGNNDKKSDKIKKEPNVFIKKYGKLKLNAFPPNGVREEDVKVNLEGDIHSHTILTWKDPKSGRTVSSYTQKFLQRNAKIKWNRIKNIKQENVDKIKSQSLKLLNSRNSTKRDAAAIIGIIVETGLRPGSEGGFNVTGNRGISTLSPKNVIIKEDMIVLNFVGKSYQENNAEFKNKELASYLMRKIKEKKENDFIFDVSKNQLDKVFHSIAKSGMKIKDLRTYAATKMAKEILETDTTPPPPLPEKPSQIKKVVKTKLKNVFEKVSQKLNNTPAMAKSSYIHPKVIENWLKTIGVEPSIAEFYIDKKLSDITRIINEIEDNIKNSSKMNQEDLENCDEFLLPDWWENENIQLIKKSTS
jgi:DNA topoisomerase-1